MTVSGTGHIRHAGGGARQDGHSERHRARRREWRELHGQQHRDDHSQHPGAAAQTTVVASDKTYDGATTATLTACTLGAGGAGGVVGGDVVSCDFGSATATFASKDIGSHAVDVSGLGLVGERRATTRSRHRVDDSGDLRQGTDGTMTADPKVYDGTTAATIHVTLGPGVVGNETVTVSGTGHSTRRRRGPARRSQRVTSRSAARMRATTRSTTARRPPPISRRGG